MKEQKEHIEKIELPTVKDAAVEVRKASKTVKKTKKTTSSKHTLKLEVLKAEMVKGGYNSRRLCSFRITEMAANRLSEIHAGLIKAGAKLSDGTNVVTKEHTVTWILENLI